MYCYIPYTVFPPRSTKFGRFCAFGKYLPARVTAPAHPRSEQVSFGDPAIGAVTSTREGGGFILPVKLVLSIAFVSGVLSASRAFTAATVYTDRASFESAIGPHVTYTFETADGFPAAPASLTSYGPFIATGIFNGSAYIVHFPIGSTNQLLRRGDPNTTLAPTTLSIDFTTPEFAVGFDDFPNGPQGAVIITYLGNAGTYNEGYTLPAFQDDSASVFFGLTSTDQIVTVVIRSVADLKGQRNEGIDNLTLVPEPCEIGLLIFLPTLCLCTNRSRNLRGK